MTTEIIYSLVIIFIFSVFFITNQIKKYQLEKFKLQLEKSKNITKEKFLYSKKLKSIGQQVYPDYQLQTMATIYELLKKTEKDYQQDPSAIPNKMEQALADINYKYTIIHND
jgi:nitrogen fixation/metabolism regulation signal transduction histidine kinase